MKAEADREDQAGAEKAERNSADAATRAEADVATRTRTKAEVATTSLMEAVVERGNMKLAYQRVVENKGAAGVDELAVSELEDHLKRYRPTIRARLLAGSYWPMAVRRVDIPKPQGGVRTLGIPTVVDRLIQQALHQVLQPVFEPTFSDASYGFRPGRNAHQALRQARQYVASGKRWVVDMDLEKFFDRVNHDLLMSKLAAKIGDARVLTLIRRYLQAGMMADGLVQPRTEGTPQGGPLSPLLSNILLTELDRELERRGHAFCRYADDCNIYVGSERAGVQLLQSLTWFVFERLKLTVNVREELRSARGRSLAATIQRLNPMLRGWAAYFKLTETKRALEERDGWIRHKLRCVLWRQWKRPSARERNLMQRGLTADRAWRSATNGRGPWWNAGASHMHAACPKSWFDTLGLVSLLDTVQRLQRIS